MKIRNLHILTILPVIITCFVLPFLPDSIPMHYNSLGAIDRWGSKYEIFIVLGLIILFAFFWNWFIAFFKKKKEMNFHEKQRMDIIHNEKVVLTSAVVVMFMLNFLYCVMLFNIVITIL